RRTASADLLHLRHSSPESRPAPVLQGALRDVADARRFSLAALLASAAHGSRHGDECRFALSRLSERPARHAALSPHLSRCARAAHEDARLPPDERGLTVVLLRDAGFFRGGAGAQLFLPPRPS